MAKYFITAIFCIFFLSSCDSQQTPEEEIQEYIADVESLFENRQPTKLKKYISAKYRDNHGYTQKDLVRFAAGYVLQRPAIHIKSQIRDLIIGEAGNKAEIRIDIAVSREPFEEHDIRMIPAEYHRFNVILEKDSAWQLNSLQWQDISIEDYIN